MRCMCVGLEFLYEGWDLCLCSSQQNVPLLFFSAKGKNPSNPVEMVTNEALPEGNNANNEAVLLENPRIL